MLYSALTCLVLTAFAQDEDAAKSLPLMSLDGDVQEPAAPAAVDQDPPAPPPQGQQQPRPKQPGPPPPDRPEPPAYKGPPCPVTLSLNGRLPFPLGATRFGTFNGGSTVLGRRVRYDDLFRRNGWGAGAELSFLSTDWQEEDTRAVRDGDTRHTPAAVDRHGSGFYLSGQFDRFGGDSVPLSAGTSLKTERVNVETMFVGFKDHQPWGGGFFTEFRVGGGAIHYGPTMAAFSTGAGASRAELFQGTWGPAAEIAGRVGIHLGGSTVLFAGGEAYAAQGPREGQGLPFTVNTSTFFAVAAEAGLQFGF